jgi:hypothetical protein
MFKSQVYDQATHDSRFRQVVAEWSQCMGQEGFHYDSPCCPASKMSMKRALKMSMTVG